MKTWLPGVALMAMLLMFAGGCESTQKTSKPSSDPTATSLPKLRVGVARTMPPVIFKDGEDETIGIEADLARELAAELGREAYFEPIYFPNLIYELRSGRIDIIMSGMSITDNRKQQVAFTEPYLIIGQKALIRAEDKPTLGTNDAIAKARIRLGVEDSATGELFANRKLVDADITTFKTFDDAVEGLIAKRVDAVLHDSPSISWAVRNHPDADLYAVPNHFTTEHLAWAVAEDNEQLLTEVNAVLKKWKASGRLRELVGVWIPNLN